MPAAALVKGILLSLGVLAALGFAAYENPEVQAWIDEQRRRLAELLRGIGEELDPQSRREAEAFAFQGRSPPVQEQAIRPTGQTTGASVANDTLRRIPVQGRLSDEDTEERQRLGREYLAARTHFLQTMRQRRGLEQSRDLTPEAAPEIVAETETKTPEVKTEQSEAVKEESSQEAPPLPPKIKLEEVEPMPWVVAEEAPSMPGAFNDEMSYDDQIAHAIALSKQESALVQAESHQAANTYDADVKKAVEASLRDFALHTSQPVVNAPHSNVWTTEDDLYAVTPNLTRASLAAWNEQSQVEMVANPVPTEDSVSWWNSEHAQSEARSGEIVHAADSEADVLSETGIVTPDSWTEVGSIPEEPERHAA